MDHPEQGIEAEADEHGELRDDERRCERERAGNPGERDRRTRAWRPSGPHCEEDAGGHHEVESG